MPTTHEQTLTSLDPATGEVVGEVPVTPAANIAGIVEAAREAAAPWRALSHQERAGRLALAGEALVARSEELGTLLSREMGKPRARGIGEVRSCGAGMRTKAERATAALAPVVEVANGVETTIYRDPLGVCGVITPWNYPMLTTHWMIVPALMAGNAVVLKPSEETPLIGQAYAEVLMEVLPDGVLRVVHGGDEQGRALVASSVDLVAFTGSREAGIHIMAAAAHGLKRLILELGGKDPLIVLDDADLEAAARMAVNNSFDNAGQTCVSTERVLVDAAIADAFEARVVELARDVKAGPWNADGVTYGPMIHARQRDHVIGHIREALEAGATALLGGPDQPERYIEPTVLTGVTGDMRIAQEETFGPVVCISRFESVSDAVREANASPFGLGALVFGGDASRAHDVARQLDAGMIGVNRSLGGVGDTPWVGAKQSGFGYHGSADGTRQFAQTRVVSRVAAPAEVPAEVPAADGADANPGPARPAASRAS